MQTVKFVLFFMLKIFNWTECTYLVINQKLRFYDENTIEKYIMQSHFYNGTFTVLDFPVCDYQELPNQCGFDSNQIVKDLFSALAEGEGNMGWAVMLQPTGLAYAESLLKFAFLLDEQVWLGHSRQNIMRIVNDFHILITDHMFLQFIFPAK